MLFFGKNPFTQEVRESIQWILLFHFRTSMPLRFKSQGFTVETLPAASKMVMEDNLGSFKYEIIQNEDKIQLSIQHQINEAIVGIEKYEMLKLQIKIAKNLKNSFKKNLIEDFGVRDSIFFIHIVIFSRK
jgi:hypothetical protein